MKRFKNKFFTAILITYISHNVCADVRLPKIFSSHMVVQRDMPIQIWGWAEPGEEVIIFLAENSVSTKANKQGRWFTKLPAMEAGGPFDLIINGKNKIVFNDVLVGDVWICSGQSNMQWNIQQTGFQETDTTFIRQGNIRLFTAEIQMDYMPREDIAGSGWKKLSKENVDLFSAVSYHFGKYLHGQLNVPIGLISNNLGATSIETWMSNEALLKFPQFQSIIGPIVKEEKNFDALQAAFEKKKSRWCEKYYHQGIGMDEEWFKPSTDITDWKPIKVSGNTWEEDPDLKYHDGEVWFRTTFDLPENYSRDNFKISLCQIDDYDIAWVNGVKIGETYGRHNHRNYNVPPGLLKDKGNTLVVRVFDIGGIGGFTTSSFWGNTILWGSWVYKKGTTIDINKFPKANLPNATPFSSPAVLYNGNIAPMTSLAIKGVIWYQGESNADRAYEYRKLFPAMIKDWRSQWKQGDFPFLFVQLANHYEEAATPKQSTWAELREAQAMTLALPNTGMATAIDIGEAKDIHPKNKLDVGKRLGMAAMKVAYHKQVIATGPVFSKMRMNGNSIVIEYDNVGGGLITKDKYDYVRGFQIAGADQKFYWAQATIADNTIVVSCKDVRDPVAVRYAWDDNPGPLDLYNKEGLPATPFRTDQWKGITADILFKDGPRF